MTDGMIENQRSKGILMDLTHRLVEQFENAFYFPAYEIMMDDSIPDYAAVNSSVNLTRNILSKKSAGFTNAILRKLTFKKHNENEWTNEDILIINSDEWIVFMLFFK